MRRRRSLVRSSPLPISPPVDADLLSRADSKKLKKTKKAVASTLAGSFEESDVALSSSSEDEVEFVPAAVKPAKAAPTANPKVKRPLRSSVKVERSTTPEVEPPVLPPSPPPAASSSTSSRAGRGRKTSSAGSSTAIADITVSTASNSKKRQLDAVSTSTPTDDAGNAKARKSEKRARKKVRLEKALATLFKSLEVVVEGLKALKEAMLEEEEE